MDSRAEHVNMEKADNTVSEAARLAALGRYDVHTPAQAPFDDLAALGAFERPLPLLAARDQRLLELSLPAAQVHGPVVLCVDPQAPAEALVRRAGWLANGA